MPYTIDHLYKKVLEGTDKMGGDFYPLPYVMNRLETATHDFIGETVKFIENTQEIKDDLRTLYTPFRIELTEDPNDAGYKVAVLPNEYQHLMEAKVVNADVPVRDTRIIKHGQLEIYQSNPNKRATEQYPIIVQYSDYLRVVSPGEPKFIVGFYVAKPIFGDYEGDIQTEIAVNLPDYATDKIIKTIITDIFVSIGDPRSGSQYQERENYRVRGQ